MRSGLTERGTRVVRQMATAQMLQTCVVERLTAPSFDNTTLVASPGTRTTIYTGVCRIWEQDSPSQVTFGSQTDFLAYSTVLSLPWDTPTANIPELLDEVEITASPTDDQWVGARFRIQTLKQGGQMRATRSFVLERLTPRTP